MSEKISKTAKASLGKKVAAKPAPKVATILGPTPRGYIAVDYCRDTARVGQNFNLLKLRKQLCAKGYRVAGDVE